MNKVTLLAVSFLVISISPLTACIPPKQKELALKAIDQYHAYFNDSRFLEIYDDSTAGLKTTMSREEFLESMNAMRQGQGRVLRSEELSTDYQSSSDDVKIKLLMLVTFEKGQAREEFVYRISEGKVQLAGYRFLGP